MNGDDVAQRLGWLVISLAICTLVFLVTR